MNANDESVGHLLSRIAADLAEQGALQLELTKAQISREAVVLGRLGTFLAIAVASFGLGVGFASFAAALALGEVLGPAGGFAAVGLVHLILGGGALYLGFARSRRPVSLVGADQPGADRSNQTGAEPGRLELARAN